MKTIDIIKIAINSSENLSKEKRDECIEYINNSHNKINEDIELIEKLKEKNEIYKITIKGQHRRIEELKQAKKVSKQIQKERNKRLRKENELLKERIDKALDKLKEHKYDLDYETWSIYKVSGLILFDLVDILGGKE